MSIYGQMALKIIEEQELIIGPLAWIEAGKVEGFKKLNESKEGSELPATEEKEIIDHLVAQYEKLFGSTSKEVCKEAVASFLAEIPQEDIPVSLK